MAKKESKTDKSSEKVADRDRELEEKLLELKKEHQKLHEKKIATERDRQNLEERLRELREQAEREYGTSDIEALRRLLEERRQENERMVADYERHVKEINDRLAEIEKAAEEGH